MKAKIKSLIQKAEKRRDWAIRQIQKSTSVNEKKIYEAISLENSFIIRDIEDLLIGLESDEI